MKNSLDYINNPEEYKKELFGAFKRAFSGTIKETFLLEMVNRVENDPRYATIFLGNGNIDRMLSIDSAVGKRRYDPACICKMIVMCHYSNTACLTDSERGKLQSSEEYKRKLTSEVIQMYFLEKLTTPDFSGASLETFLPIIYYSTAVNNYLVEKFEGSNIQQISVNKSFNDKFNRIIIYKLLTKIKACISLADIRATDELLIIYRSLIELFMTYAALWDENDLLINSFFEFDEAAFNYNYNKSISEKYKTLAKDMGANFVSFINYGWMKDLDEFKKFSNKTKLFNINGLATILDKKYVDINPKLGSELYKFYKTCNPQTHGTIKFMNFYQLELHVFVTISVMLSFIGHVMSEHLFKFDFKFGNLDLMNELEKIREQTIPSYEFISNDTELLNKTNEDYRKRAICSIRLK